MTTQQPKQKLSVSVPADVASSVREYAREHGQTVSDAMAGLVRRALLVESVASHARTLPASWWDGYLSEVDAA